MADVTGDAVAVHDGRATDDGLAIGDTVPFVFADGSETELVVAAIYEADLPTSGDFILDIATFEAHVADQFDRMLFVSVDDSAAAATSRAAIEEAVAAWPNATIEDQAEFKESVTSEIDTMLNLIYGLLALAVVISLIGIANTLALSVSERTRELGLLRAVGMHRSQLKRAVRWEALLISGLGAIAGTGLAIAGAWGVVGALGSEGITRLVVPGTSLAVIAGLAGAGRRARRHRSRPSGIEARRAGGPRRRVRSLADEPRGAGHQARTPPSRPGSMRWIEGARPASYSRMRVFWKALMAQRSPSSTRTAVIRDRLVPWSGPDGASSVDEATAITTPGTSVRASSTR